MVSNDIQVKGLTKRWLINVTSVIVVLVLLAETLLSILIYNTYVNSVKGEINSQIAMSTPFFESVSKLGSTEYEQSCKDYTAKYARKNATELQMIDKYGNVIASSQGFVSNTSFYPDYTSALEASDGKGSYLGKNENGEHIMAVCVMMPEASGESIGAARFIISMEKVYENILQNILFAIMIGILIILISAGSGFLFLRQILKPIRDITSAAFRIASGKFDDRLPVTNADEIGKLCDTINYMAQELESAEKIKNDFISTVSHELRTPLTVIKGWGETVKASEGTDPEITERGINIIIHESERLSSLVEDLLDFSRMQSGRAQMQMQKIDILAELGEAVYMYKGMAQDEGVTLDYIEPEMLPPVMADANRLRQVFINIIDNAIKYSADGGHVLVEASLHDVFVQVTVKDTGCGIAAQDIGKVKEKFYKANTTVRGSGIGLAIADEIIKQHDGILEIESTEGAGTTVTIALPFIKTEN